jgi:hypothetical protein
VPPPGGLTPWPRVSLPLQSLQPHPMADDASVPQVSGQGASPLRGASSQVRGYATHPVPHCFSKEEGKPAPQLPLCVVGTRQLVAQGTRDEDRREQVAACFPVAM